MNTIMYKNYNFTKILGVDSFEVKNQSSTKKIINIIKMSVSFLSKTHQILTNNKECVEYMFFKTQNRNDYDLLFQNIYNQCFFRKDIIKINRVYGVNFKYFNNIIFNFKLFYKLLHKNSFLDSIYYYVISNRYLEIIQNFDKYSFNNLVVFSDVQPIENMLVQYCNLRNIKSITMQHGLYIDYKNMPNINMLNYLDVSSQYVLAWGESTEELFKRYNQDIKVVICGKPISLEQNILEKNKNLIGVVFDQPMFRKYNKKMLQIAYEIADRKNMKVIVRLHPQDDHKYYDYDKRLTQFEIDANNAFYILAHTTSMIYEYLALGYKVFKLRSDIPANEISEELKFRNSEELEKKFEMHFDFQEESLRHIKYVGDESKMRYKEFFDSFHENHRGVNAIGIEELK